MTDNPFAILGLANEDGKVGRGLVRIIRTEEKGSSGEHKNKPVANQPSRNGLTGNSRTTTSSSTRAPLREVSNLVDSVRTTLRSSNQPWLTQQRVVPLPSKPVEIPLVKTKSEKRQEFFEILKEEAKEAQKQREQVFSKSKKSEVLSQKFPTVGQNSAIRRLLHDLKQLEREPMKTVSAAPVKDNLFIWHCNLRPNSGPYAGVTFHLALTFPQNYPLEPPSLNLFTPIPHPNIYGSWICLNMLRPSCSGSYSGWSSAYTAQSILLQLQTFMMAENIPQDYGDDVKQVNDVKTVDRTKQAIDNFKCNECGHCYKKPNPPLPPAELDQTTGGTRVPEDSLSSMLSETDNILDINQSSDQLWLDDSKLICGSDSTEGWFGVRAFNGFQLGGDIKRTLYYEVYVAGTGVSRVGFSISGASFNLGTDWRGWGYGGTGKKSNCGNFTDYGEGYRKGDIIGCALDLVTGDVVFFKNGQCQGLAFTIPAVYRGRRFFPTVAVRNMFFMVNFGAKGFAFSPKEIKQQGCSTLQQPAKKNRFFSSSRSRSSSSAAAAAVSSLPQLPLFTEKEFPTLATSSKTKVITSFNTTVWNNIQVAQPPPPQPKLKQPQQPIKQKPKSNKRPSKNPFVNLPPELIAHILNFLDDFGLRRAATSHPLFSRVVKSYFLLEKRELICFHSKKSFQEDVLGFGLYIDPKHKTVRMNGDLISYSAYYLDKVKKGVWGEEINKFLPLIINSTYREKRKIIPLLKNCLKPKNEINWKPAQALNVLPSLMSSIITNFLQSAMKTRISPHLCEKALEGYLNIHHMLLSLDRDEPALSAMVDKVIHMIKDGQEVGLGLNEIICALSISSYQLEDIQHHLVNEFWAKHVKLYYGLWIDMSTGRKVEVLVKETFRVMKDKIFIFFAHLEFLKWFAKSKSKEKMLQLYDRSFGRVNDTMTSQLGECCNSIIDAMDAFDGTGMDCIGVFYGSLGLPCPSLPEFVSLIQNNRNTRYLSKK